MTYAAEIISSTLSDTQPAIELVSIGLPSEKVEGFAKAVRALGMPVHSNYPTTAHLLEQRLQGADNHVILADTRHAFVDLEVLLEMRTAAGSDVAVVVFGTATEKPVGNKVRDFILPADEGRVPLVIMREYGDLMTRRRLRQAERRLLETEHRCDALMESSKEAIAYVHEGMHIRGNAVYLGLFNIPDAESMEGLPLMDLVKKEFRKDLKRFLNVAGFGTEGPRYLETDCQTIDGKAFSATIEFTAATIDGEPCTQIIVRREEASEELRQLKRLANRDPTTGLYHRNYFLAAMEEALPKLYADEHRQYVLLYMAIDNFSEIRDNYGLDFAEALLKESADVLSRNIGEDVLLAQFGDYSFTVLTQVSKPEEAADLAKNLREVLANHAFTSVQHFIAPTLSVGIARSKQGRVTTVQEFINRSYKAFQSAVAAGGNCALEYDPSTAADEHGSAEDSAAIEMVDFALSHNRFVLRYQPMVAIKNAPGNHYLTCLYLRDADDKEHPASAFLTQAQGVGKLTDIDRWVIEKSLAELSKAKLPGRTAQSIHFHIPLSAASFGDEKLVSWLRGELAQAQVKPSHLTFIVDNEQVRQQLHIARLLTSALQKLGCHVMLDRFGTSPEDHALLKHLPAVSGVRYDSSLSQGLDSNRERSTHLGELNQRLQEEGLQSVVTDVEHPGELALVWTLGIDFIQGDFVSPPLEVPDFDFSQY